MSDNLSPSLSVKLLDEIKLRVLLADGAMGTQLQQHGIEPGGSGEKWNIEKPDSIFLIQNEYVKAGSDCLLTNTFGASRIMLERHDLAEHVEKINMAGVNLARKSFGEKPGFVLGVIGPFGGLMEPYGEISQEDVFKTFSEQAHALQKSGVDAIIIETQTALEEIKLAIQAAKDAKALCVIASMAFDLNKDGKDVRTMMGVKVEQAAETLQNAGADILSINCGTGVNMKWAAKILKRFSKISDLPLMAKPNNGLPELVNMEVVYGQSPEEMVVGLEDVLEAGVSIIGGCCGTTPHHIGMMRTIIDKWND